MTIRQSFFNKEVVGSMRALMTAGKALERCNTVGYNCAAVAVDNPRVFDEHFYLLMGGSGNGFSVERQYINKMPVVAEEMHETDTTIVVNDSRAGWAKAFKELIALLYNGDIPKYDTSKVRKAGERLKTMGGRASGPLPLIRLFEYTVRTFKRAKGRKLNSAECHKLMCKIAETVIVGSVRRSACISFGNLTDDRHRRLKTGDWWNTSPELALANNSTMYTEKPDLESFTKEFRSIHKSKAGERGLVNQEALQGKADMCDRDSSGKHSYLLNPCVIGSTNLLTDSGYFPINELVGKKVNVWNGERFSEVTPYSTGINNLMDVEFSNGVKITCTPYHKFILNGDIRVKAKDLMIGDKMHKYAMPDTDTHGSDPVIDAYSQGFYCGDGEKNSKRSKLYFTKFVCSDKLCGNIVDYNETYKSWIHGEMLEKEYVPVNTSSKFKYNWLAGILDSDGHIQKNPNSVQLVISSVDAEFLGDIRLMLTTMGVQGTVSKMRDGGLQILPDGKGGSREYLCKTTHRLLINAYDTALLVANGLTCERLHIDKLSPNRDARRFVTIKSIKHLDDVEETFCATEEHNNTLCLNGMITGNCAEAILRDSGGLCNLSEVIVRPEDTLEILKEKTRIATIIGTLQSTLTNFKYLRKIWKDNAEEERLLGVSLTGQMDHKILSNPLTAGDWLDEMRLVAIKTNIKYSKLLGISESKQLTLVKPSGTVSLLCSTASGMHPRHAPYYIRRVTQDIKDPLTSLMLLEGVPSVSTGEKVIFSFPVKSPDESRTNVGTMEQLDLWLVYQEHWCDGNPSQTIYYTDDTFLDLQAWVWKHWDEIGGLSFFPKNDNVYENQPFEEISKDEYDKLNEEFPKVNWSNLSDFESDDQTSTNEVGSACGGGACDI